MSQNGEFKFSVLHLELEFTLTPFSSHIFPSKKKGRRAFCGVRANEVSDLMFLLGITFISFHSLYVLDKNS